MLEELSSDGKWWLPNKDSIQFSGTLTFDPKDGGILTVSALTELFFKAGLSHDIHDFLMLGELFDGSKVTLHIESLLNYHETYNVDHGYSFAKYVFNIKFIFLGSHFYKTDDIEFENILVRYPNMDKWVLDHDIINIKKTKFDPEKIEFECIYGKPIEVRIDDNCLIQISYIPNISIDAIKQESRISEHVYVKIYSYKQKDLSRYIVLKNLFQDFLNFVFSDTVITLSLEGVVASTKFDRKERRHVKILYKSTMSEKMDKIIIKKPYLFRYEEIKDKFPSLIKRWFNIKSKIGFAYELFFGDMYNSEQYLPYKFLMLCQAIEVYYRKIFEKSSPIRHEHEKTTNMIISHVENLKISHEYKNRLKTWMREKNHPSFKEQLTELYDYYSQIAPQLSIKLQDKETFANRIRDYRNDLVHGNLNSDDIDNEDLFWNYKNLQLFLQLCILSQLGFSNDEIKEIYYIKDIEAR